jgi:DNA-3-methyladenine glycosylase
MAGTEIMARRRKAVSEVRLANLTNGPGKLCMAMGISARQNGADMCASPLHIDAGVTVDKARMAQTARINVDYAEEWRYLRWRFLIGDSAFASTR